MRHPRRNEIYRDVGTAEHTPHDPAFIDIVTFGMPSDGAILLCSDGLTDLVGSAEIRAGLERYAPDYEAAIAALIDAANHAGGKDNITVVVVAAPGYMAQPLQAAPPRKTAIRRKRGWLPVTAALTGGLALGLGAGLLIPVLKNQLAASGPRTLLVGAAGINATLLQAHSGDTVIIPEGRYKERIELRQGVTVRARQPATVTLISPDGGPPVVARKVETGSLEGLWIQGSTEAPASIGIQLVDSSPAISNVRVTGAVTGVDVSGVSSPVIAASKIANNSGVGILIEGAATPHLDSNLIVANGNGTAGEPKPGIEVQESARPVLKDNAIIDNAAEAVWIHGHTWQSADFQENFFGGLPLNKAVRMVDQPVPAPVSKTPAGPEQKTPAPKSPAGTPKPNVTPKSVATPKKVLP